MKKILALVLVFAMVVSFAACGKKTKGKEIPDVFGISYTDAESILKEEGFEVTAIETDVEGISEKLLYPLEKVSKGTVFKVDDYILDNSGNLTKNYDILYDEDFISEDNSVVIYYAKEDYVLKKENDSATDNTTPEEETVTENQETKKDDNVLREEFKSAMDSYEKFMDEYVAFMKKYNANPSDLSILAEYSNYMSKYADFVKNFEKWESEEMNAAETAYYIEVQARVNKKLLEVVS